MVREGGEIELVKRYALPRRAAGARGHMSQFHYSAIWTLNRIKELLALIEKENYQEGLEEGQLRQWNGLVRKFCSPSAPLMELTKIQEMDDLHQKIQRAHPRKATLKVVLEAARECLVDHTQRASKEQEKKSRNGWRKWLAKQSDAGGASGAAYAFVKRVQQDPDLVVSCMEGRSAAPQDVVSADLEEWKEVWESLRDRADAPWRKIQWEKEERGSMSKITVDQFRGVARSFKVNTGVGIDGIAPHQFAWLSDELVQCLLQMLEKQRRNASGLNRFPVR